MHLFTLKQFHYSNTVSNQLVNLCLHTRATERAGVIEAVERVTDEQLAFICQQPLRYQASGRQTSPSAPLPDDQGGLSHLASV